MGPETRGTDKKTAASGGGLGECVGLVGEGQGEPPQLRQGLQGLLGQVLRGAAAQTQTEVGTGPGRVGLGDRGEKDQNPVPVGQPVEQVGAGAVCEDNGGAGE